MCWELGSGRSVYSTIYAALTSIVGVSRGRQVARSTVNTRIRKTDREFFPDVPPGGSAYWGVAPRQPRRYCLVSFSTNASLLGSAARFTFSSGSSMWS